MNRFGQKIWLAYDSFSDMKRFFCFLAFIVLPVTVIRHFGFIHAMTYMVILVSWRMFSMEQVRRKL